MIELLKQEVEEKLKNHPNRLLHVLGVYETAVKLARHYQIDEEKIGISAIFHDYTKYDAMSDQIKWLTKEEIVRYKTYPVMYHALSAAKVLEMTYNIHDQDILDPIKSHVWGKKAMSMYEKIIFISDYAEPNRTFFDPHEIYDLALKNIDQAVLVCMKITIDYLLKEHMAPSEEQLEAYQYYTEVTRGKIKQNY
jgi:predicted HD superfamily hydrolase involved in NAD metabolism